MYATLKINSFPYVGVFSILDYHPSKKHFKIDRGVSGVVDLVPLSVLEEAEAKELDANLKKMALDFKEKTKDIFDEIEILKKDDK